MASQEELVQFVKEEIVRCKKDPAYFMRKYCYIQHPQRGRVLFNLYPFQEKVLHLVRDNRNTLILKSRQLGISTLMAGYSLWLIVFHRDKSVLALANTQATARAIVTKTKFMYDELPQWMRVGATEKNKLSLRLANGSSIVAKSSNPESARSDSLAHLIIDECQKSSENQLILRNKSTGEIIKTSFEELYENSLYL